MPQRVVCNFREICENHDNLLAVFSFCYEIFIQRKIDFLPHFRLSRFQFCAVDERAGDYSAALARANRARANSDAEIFADNYADTRRLTDCDDAARSIFAGAAIADSLGFIETAAFARAGRR